VPEAEPRSRRGKETRAALIAAARRVFERDGFIAARIVDVAAEAGVATGSFYTYFDGKEEAFTAVMEEVKEEMLHPVLAASGIEDDPAATIRAANRAYLESYHRNVRLMALMEQVATIDAGFRQVRRRRVEDFARRNAKLIARLQKQGLADPELDPDLASTALSAMVSRAAYISFVLGGETEVEPLVETVTRLWINALRLPPNA
jgi:AcrR family transcriptional regulator